MFSEFARRDNSATNLFVEGEVTNAAMRLVFLLSSAAEMSLSGPIAPKRVHLADKTAEYAVPGGRDLTTAFVSRVTSVATGSSLEPP